MRRVSWVTIYRADLSLQFQDAVMPGYWMNEGGQSSTGQVRGADFDRSVLYAHYTAQLIHFITTTHPAYPGLLKIAKEENSSPHEGLHIASHMVDDLWSD